MEWKIKNKRLPQRGSLSVTERLIKATPHKERLTALLHICLNKNPE
jgi:hypothetical protein